MIQKQVVSASEGVRVVRLAVPAGGVVPEHHASVDVVATIVRGTGEFSVEGTPRAVACGDVIVMKPRQRHAIRADTDLELVVVHARVTAGDAPTTCGAEGA